MDNRACEGVHYSMFTIGMFHEHGNELSGSIQEEKYLTGTIIVHL
jgi:hypothetical protein